MTEKLTVEVAVRPTRLGLLVDPADATSISRFMRLSTCIWGGALNPIIPVADRLPEHWTNNRVQPNGMMVAYHYLNFFEPDVLVEAQEGLAEQVGWIPEGLSQRPNHVLTLDQLVDSDPDARLRAGVSSAEAFMARFKRETQFVLREPTTWIAPSEGDQSGFAEAVWGVFPQDPNLAFVQRVYRDVFRPETITASAETWLAYYREHKASPLYAGREGVEIQAHHREDLRIFVFDPTQAADRLDLWNLRLFRQPVMPVPAAWLPTASQFLHDTLAKGYSLGNHEAPIPMENAVVEFSESLEPSLVDDLIADHFASTGASIQRRYDRPGYLRITGNIVRRNKTVAVERPGELQIDGNGFGNLAALAPPFETHHDINTFSWINVVNFPFRPSFESDLATVFPFNSADRRFPRLERIAWTQTMVCSEGLVFPQTFKNRELLIGLPRQAEAMIDWLAHAGVQATPSGAGRIAQELLRALGGPWGAHLISEREIVELLNKMAGSEVSHSARGGGKVVRRYEGKTASVLDWKGLLSRLRAKKGFSHGVSAFVERNALRLGLSTKCAFCNQDNWYPLDKMAYQLDCERCLRTFPVPEEITKEAAWRYRVIGSFAVPNYADGGYAVALALRFITLLINPESEATISTALELTWSGQTTEIDFAGWWRKRPYGAQREEPVLLFGEAKSFAADAIDAKVIAGFDRLAERFSSAIFVAVKLADRFSDSEKALLGDFAERRRQAGYPSSLLVLTGRELLARSFVNDNWRVAGPPFDEHAQGRNDWDIRQLAQASCRLYLQAR